MNRLVLLVEWGPYILQCNMSLHPSPVIRNDCWKCRCLWLAMASASLGATYTVVIWRYAMSYKITSKYQSTSFDHHYSKKSLIQREPHSNPMCLPLAQNTMSALHLDPRSRSLCATEVPVSIVFNVTTETPEARLC